MTTWIESSGGGRQRGLQGLMRAWITVIIHPRRFFRNSIASGDQAPGLVFATAVTLIHTATRFAFASPSETPSVPLLALILLLVALLVTPVALHLVAALETALLVPLVKSRGGVSQTVQVIAYAVAPCALSGVPVRALCALPDTLTLCSLSGVVVPVLWLATAVYGAALLVIGTVVVHDTSVPRAVVVTTLPSLIVFGYGFRGVQALELLSTSAVV